MVPRAARRKRSGTRKVQRLAQTPLRPRLSSPARAWLNAPLNGHLAAVAQRQIPDRGFALPTEVSTRPRVGLFVTCLVDLIRPSIGFAAVKLLEDAGCSVEVPSQTCCGQPAFNSGDRATARAIAGQVIEAFAGLDYVVAPSGSCAGMIKVHFPELFAEDPNLVGPAREL